MFIGGTAYSGSTLLDMIIANDACGFSFGEVSALVYPFRRHHVDPVCGCGDPDCTIWQDRALRTKTVHLRMFERFPGKTFHVDSSKSLPWIVDQCGLLKARGVRPVDVLIWKSPEEYFLSRYKRGDTKGWERSWIHYHESYFHYRRNWISVSYSDLVSDPSVLETLCQRLGIPYFKGKEEYWNANHHTLFGNSSAKIHLHEQNSPQFEKHARELARHEGADFASEEIEHRKVCRAQRQIAAPTISARNSERVDKILSILEATDVRSTVPNAIGHQGRRRSRGFHAARQLRQRIKRAMLSGWTNIRYR